MEKIYTAAEIDSLIEDFISSDDILAKFKSELTNALKNYVRTTGLENATVAAAGKADKLATPRIIQLSGQVTGNVTFDGSQNVTMSVNVLRASSAAQADSCGSCSYAISAGNALSATSAINDSSGNNISKTYATKTELNNLAATLPSFSFANGILTISDGRNSYKFVGEVV